MQLCENDAVNVACIICYVHYVTVETSRTKN